MARDRHHSRRGAALLAGGLAVALLLEPRGPLAFFWLPLLTGAAYLLAAALGGRRGPLWAPGVVLGTWGLAVALVSDGRIRTDREPTLITALGVGALLAAVLARAGFAVTVLGVASAVLLAGLFELLAAEGPAGLGGNPLLYAGLLGVWGIVELRPRR